MINPHEILIVDDEPNVRFVFRTALESVGYGVSEASDGETALEMIRRRDFNGVLLEQGELDEADFFLRLAAPLGADSAVVARLASEVNQLRQQKGLGAYRVAGGLARS